MKDIWVMMLIVTVAAIVVISFLGEIARSLTWIKWLVS